MSEDDDLRQNSVTRDKEGVFTIDVNPDTNEKTVERRYLRAPRSNSSTPKPFTRREVGPGTGSVTQPPFTLEQQSKGGKARKGRKNKATLMRDALEAVFNDPKSADYIPEDDNAGVTKFLMAIAMQAQAGDANSQRMVMERLIAPLKAAEAKVGDDADARPRSNSERRERLLSLVAGGAAGGDGLPALLGALGANDGAADDSGSESS